MQGRLWRITGKFIALQEPSGPLPPAIARLTGVTDAMLAGQRIDLDAVEAFIAEPDLVIALHASFDWPFCERLARGFAPKPRACSVKEVPWADFGCEGSKLGYLVGQAGWCQTGHRATDDCHALLAVLAPPLPDGTGSAFTHLLERSEAVRLRIWAEGAPFELKDQLRRRGCRRSDGRDGRPRAWWVEVDEALASEEIAFLENEIYMRRLKPWSQRVTACERYRPRSVACDDERPWPSSVGWRPDRALTRLDARRRASWSRGFKRSGSGRSPVEWAETAGAPGEPGVPTGRTAVTRRDGAHEV